MTNKSLLFHIVKEISVGRVFIFVIASIHVASIIFCTDVSSLKLRFLASNET